MHPLQSLHEKQFVLMRLYLGATGIIAVPIVTCSGFYTAATPTNGIVGTTDNTSRPYKSVDFVGGGWYVEAVITSRPTVFGP